MKVVGDFFAFITLVAVLMVVIAALNHPAGITGVLDGFNKILGNLKD